ncbi:MAG: preprotein translocase subunit SecA, partial [Chloroflexi bacterium]
MFKKLTGIFGDANERELKKLRPQVLRINSLEPEFEKLTDSELRDKATEFKGRFAAGEPLDSLLPEAFAAVREVAKRAIGERHFDVQLMGGIVLHQGKIAEMKTGEGKTLVATLPAYLNSLTGKGVHIVTVNDYLARRDTHWMGPIYHALGVSVGCIQHEAAYLYDPEYDSGDPVWRHLRPVPRRQAYEADVTYGTNNEFGFDYLRDNMVTDLSQCVQRELNYAIVDEVDNILIDEARTPLIISGQAEESTQKYYTFARLVPRLRPGEDYQVDEKLRTATLTESGMAKMEKWLGVSNLYDPQNYELVHYIENALRAHVFYKRDREYVVKDGEVIIVDEFTGRLMFGRRYSEGLHQAIEAKEGVKVRQESITLATITFQNYFRMYKKLAGMTGTAATEAEEFHKIYGLEVVVIPTNKPLIRYEYPDRIYKTEEAKFRAVVKEIEELHRQGRPVLVGTVSIEKSEKLSQMLKQKGIPHQVLNAKYHEKEAAIIAQAGRPGAVTIATNMAGRGVDILLGGNPEGLAKDALRREGFDLSQIPFLEWDDAVKLLKRGEDPTKKYPTHWAEVLKATFAQWQRDHQKVVELGGLHVIGTERHEARRIDNQLRGRAGRQGDPGSSRFYVSLEDDIMVRFGGEQIKKLMDLVGFDEDTPIEHSLVSKAIQN